MGRGRELDVCEREAFFKCIHDMYDREEVADILEAYDKMLQKHPNDAYLLHGKANVLYYSQFKKHQDMPVANEIISLCNKINCSSNSGMQCGANALLVRVYARIGQLEEARKLANGLPSFEVGRELLILECLQGAERNAYCQYLIERFEGMIARYTKRMNE